MKHSRNNSLDTAISTILFSIVAITIICLLLTGAISPYLLFGVGFLTLPCSLIFLPLFGYKIYQLEHGRKQSASNYSLMVMLTAPYVVSFLGTLIHLAVIFLGVIIPKNVTQIFTALTLAPAAVVYYVPFLWVLRRFLEEFPSKARLIYFLSPIIFAAFVFGPPALLLQIKTVDSKVMYMFIYPSLYIGYIVLGYYHWMIDIAHKRHWLSD